MDEIWVKDFNFTIDTLGLTMNFWMHNEASRRPWKQVTTIRGPSVLNIDEPFTTQIYIDGKRRQWKKQHIEKLMNKLTRRV
jgi:hypothetical protein